MRVFCVEHCVLLFEELGHCSCTPQAARTVSPAVLLLSECELSDVIPPWHWLLASACAWPRFLRHLNAIGSGDCMKNWRGARASLMRGGTSRAAAAAALAPPRITSHLCACALSVAVVSGEAGRLRLCAQDFY